MPAYLYLQTLCTLSKENIMQNKYELQRVLAKITLCADRRTDRQTAQQTRFETPFCKQATNFIWKWCCCCWSALWRAFIYTDRRALSAHLFGTLVQYEYKWMHIYNINTRQDKAQTHTHTHTWSCDTHTHTHRRDGQSSDNNCTVCRVKAKTTNKMNSQPHREIQWKQTNERQIVSLPTANHNSAPEREWEREWVKEEQSARERRPESSRSRLLTAH